MHEKMAREENQRLAHESSVQKMEMEELELIQRLKNTQMMQQAAFQQLENALVNGKQKWAIRSNSWIWDYKHWKITTDKYF